MKAALKWFLSGLSLCLVLSGCRFGQLPDPNDPKDVGVMAPDVLRRKLKWASDNLNERIARGELQDAEAQSLLRQYADDLIALVDLERVNINRAWEYGELFRTAKRWDLAEAALTLAVKNARNEDRRVNDSLRLAQAQAYREKVPSALRSARSVLNAKPLDSAPILPAVLLEIVPAARGKGHDAELAQLLEAAIGKHVDTIVDPKKESGSAFLVAKPFHVRNAWGKVIELYRAAGKDAQADQALQKMKRMMLSMASV